MLITQSVIPKTNHEMALLFIVFSHIRASPNFHYPGSHIEDSLFGRCVANIKRGLVGNFGGGDQPGFHLYRIVLRLMSRLPSICP